MNKSVLEIWVGFLVVIGVLAMLFLAMRAGDFSMGVGNGGSYHLRASFDNIGSLKVDAPVRSAGVIVGRVTDIHLDPKNYEAIVEMSLNNKFRYPNDTYAKIRTAGLLGEQFISLSVGGSDTDLKSGDVITKTESALALEDLIGQFLIGGGTKKSSTDSAASHNP